MSRIGPLDKATASESQMSVYRAVTEGPRGSGPRDFALTNDDGSLAGPFNALAIAGELGQAVQRVGEVLRFGGGLEDQARELAILIVARTWDCPFEWYAHEAVARRVGLDESALRALSADRKPQQLSPRLSAVYDVASEVASTRALDDATFEKSRQYIDDGDLIELLIVVGYYTLLAGLLNGLDVDLPGGDDGGSEATPDVEEKTNENS